MFAKNLVVFGVARTVPGEFAVFYPKLGAAALAAAFGHTAVEATNPGFDAGWLFCNKFDAAASVDCLAVADVGRPGEVIDLLGA